MIDNNIVYLYYFIIYLHLFHLKMLFIDPICILTLFIIFITYL